MRHFHCSCPECQNYNPAFEITRLENSDWYWHPENHREELNSLKYGTYSIVATGYCPVAYWSHLGWLQRGAYTCCGYMAIEELIQNDEEQTHHG